jgi:hypothetical protein
VASEHGFIGSSLASNVTTSEGEFYTYSQDDATIVQTTASLLCPTVVSATASASEEVLYTDGKADASSIVNSSIRPATDIASEEIMFTDGRSETSTARAPDSPRKKLCLMVMVMEL